MDSTALRALQAPLKQKYRDNPGSARIPSRRGSHARSSADCCDTPGPGGENRRVACGYRRHGSASLLRGHAARSTRSVCRRYADGGGNLDDVQIDRGSGYRRRGLGCPRGTLGVDKEAPVGLQDIALTFELEGDLDGPTRGRLIQLTERYCVILATLRNPPKILVADSGPP